MKAVQTGVLGVKVSRTKNKVKGGLCGFARGTKGWAHSPSHGASQDGGLEAHAVGAAVFENFKGVYIVVVDDDAGDVRYPRSPG